MHCSEVLPSDFKCCNESGRCLSWCQGRPSQLLERLPGMKEIGSTGTWHVWGRAMGSNNIVYCISDEILYCICFYCRPMYPNCPHLTLSLHPHNSITRSNSLRPYPSWPDHSLQVTGTSAWALHEAWQMELLTDSPTFIIPSTHYLWQHFPSDLCWLVSGVS